MLFKYLIPIMFFSAVSFTHAANETSSIRTPAGQSIILGDSYADMQSRMHLSPSSMITREFKEGKNRYLAMHYTYEVENMLYTITIVNDRVKKIEWLNTDQDINKDQITKE
ncbi:hypothetical protein B9T29_04760 [Acinetobacter sp. ANC 3903]|uniref:hypothetical protein n=1 Tax=Acinetobacter sp. ANC 3903 TaxID=1977883 RepID=UPI000A342CC3|nr:hypothetical protein [Acinetobacter sp. ANC 3903]OTG63003.1 hypothetical protein B9T29_04760 [Acinetobacter sp. ANC 3903]